MRVALINNLFVDHLGQFYISSVLKQAGHDVRMFITDRSLERQLRQFDPTLVGFTAVTGNHIWAADTARELRELLPRARFIMGGPHPTYHPEIIRHPGLDFVCRGEGEQTIVKLAAAIEAGGDVTRIAGIWAKVDGHVYENPFAPQIEDLDSIPFPDRSLYDAFPFIRHSWYPYILSSRGCPWRCTFCYAPTLADLTKGTGKFVRFRSVANVVAEGLILRNQYRVGCIEFCDDIFGMHRPWLREFADMWSREVGMPFVGNLRADLVNEEVVDLLAKAGCHGISFGLESGNERVRNEILQKEVSTEQIREAVRALRSRKIKVQTYNILGSPTETLDEAWDTVRLNQEIRPDYAWVSLMHPYPKTKIYDTAVAQGLYDDSRSFEEIASTFFDQSPLRIAHSREVGNLQKLFNLAVWFPWLEPLLQRAIRWPLTPLYYAIFIVIHISGLSRVKKVPVRFLVHIVLNLKEIRRRHRAGLYKRRLWERPADNVTPTLRERLERGAL